MTPSRLRLAGLLVAIAVGGVLAWLLLGEDLELVRSAVRDAGAWSGPVFVALHVLACLGPVPRSLLGAIAGAMFGVAGGIALSLVGSVLAAALTFAIARWLGREALAQLTGPRVDRVERLLRDQGLLAVVVARLTPVAPFVLTNYGAGISAVRTRDYAVGTLVGVVPGSVAWASVGASAGRDSTTLLVVASVAALLLAGAVLTGRRLGARRDAGTPG